MKMSYYSICWSFPSFVIRNSVDAKCRWSCTYLLDPSDPLFVEIGEAFIRRQVKGAPFFCRSFTWNSTILRTVALTKFSIYMRVSFNHFILVLHDCNGKMILDIKLESFDRR